MGPHQTAPNRESGSSILIQSVVERPDIPWLPELPPSILPTLRFPLNEAYFGLVQANERGTDGHLSEISGSRIP